VPQSQIADRKLHIEEGSARQPSTYCDSWTPAFFFPGESLIAFARIKVVRFCPMKRRAIERSLVGAFLIMIAVQARAAGPVIRSGVAGFRGAAQPMRSFGSGSPVFLNRGLARVPTQRRPVQVNNVSQPFRRDWANRHFTGNGSFFRDHRRNFSTPGLVFFSWPFYWYPPVYDGPALGYDYEAPRFQVATTGEEQPSRNDQETSVAPVLAQALADQGVINAAIVSQLAQIANANENRAESQLARPENPFPVPASKPAPPPSAAEPSPADPSNFAEIGSNLDHLVLLSWMSVGPETIVYVRNTQTRAVQKISSEADAKNRRVVLLHPDSDPRFTEAVISNGTEQVTVRFGG
jgi:hypothetical protein